MTSRYARFAAVSIATAIAGATGTALSGSRAEEALRLTRSSAPASAIQIRIPESMRAEHAGIHAELEHLTKAPGRTGAAARELAEVLHPHFLREEQIALPPLGLLAPLASGEPAKHMRAVLPLTDSLRMELPRMLEEHVGIGAAVERLRKAARAERHEGGVRFADDLAQHARSEEELLYPAAILVGELVRGRFTP